MLSNQWLMWQRQIKFLVVILGVLAFVNHTLASTATTCGSHLPISHSLKPHQMSHGSMHVNQEAHHAAFDEAENSDTSCCDHEQCDATNCLALSSTGATAVGDIPLFVIQPQSNSGSALVIVYQSITAQSLFKPPISR